MAESAKVMQQNVAMRKLEAFENPRVVPLRGDLFGACFFLMKLLPARFMLEQALERGDLKPGGMICESSSGTFGLALAMLAVQNGFRLILVSDWALDRRLHQRLVELGAHVEIMDKPAAIGGFQQARLDRLAEYLRDNPASYWPAQYSNIDNPQSYSKVAEHIIDVVGKIDCLVGPVGSGGSMSGTSRYLRALFPELRVVGVDIPNSAIFGQPSGKLCMSGLGGNIVPANVDHTQFDEIHWLAAADAYHATHRLHREHALFTGPTSGAAYLVADWWAKHHPGKTVVTLFPDEGHRYVETVYEERWLREIPGWSSPSPTEPIAVSSPAEPIESWSYFAWQRRTLQEVLALSGR